MSAQAARRTRVDGGRSEPRATPAGPARRGRSLLWQIVAVLLLGIAAFHPLDTLIGRLIPDGTLSTLVSVSVTAAGMAALLYYLFVRRLRRLNAVLARVAAGDLDERLPRARGGEIAALVEHIERMVERLRSNYDELKRNDDLRRQLVANVSHELRTPLTNIQGYLESARSASTSAPDVEHKIEICHREAQKLTRLVQDLFELSKLDAHQLEFHFETISLVELADQVGAAFEQRMIDKQIHFETRFPDEPLEVLADGNRMGQVITNLLGNAAVFTRPGGTVTLSCERAGETARLDVIDTGIGIPERDLPHIFESFFHLEKSRTRNLGGTGLGLAICKAIVDAHEGRIGVQSQVGEGTTFTIELDLAPGLPD